MGPGERQNVFDKSPDTVCVACTGRGEHTRFAYVVGSSLSPMNVIWKGTGVQGRKGVEVWCHLTSPPLLDVHVAGPFTSLLGIPAVERQMYG